MTAEVARIELAQASRILALQGVVDGFGHASSRCAGRPDQFLMSVSKAPALVEPEDVVEVNLEGEACSSPGARLFLERYIHAEIYRLRPDVQAIVHSHSPTVVPFTVVPEAELRPICHVCGFLHGVKAPFDVADHAGPCTDLLVRTPDLGRHFADHLGGSSVGLMRAHGYTAVGSSLAEAVFRAVYTVRNCQIHLASLALGTPTFLNPEEAAACDETTRRQAERAWDLWLHELSAHETEKKHGVN